VIALIVNPRAGRGRAAARAADVERALRQLGEVHRFETRGVGDERRCTRDAVAAGARVVAVVGGDGSVHHTVRGLLDTAAADAPLVPLAIFAAGTGNDFVKSLGTPSSDVASMTARIAAGITRLVDGGEIDGVPFVNAAGLGFDVEVLERMQRVTMLRGTAAYVVTALRALLGYGGYRASWTHTNGGRSIAHHLLTVFANGATFGGTFRIAPNAALDDGLLDLIDIAALSPLARPNVFLRAIRGTHLTHPSVTHERGSSWTITSDHPLAFEADGERYEARGTIIEVRVRPGALRVVA
jgi:diacylglycerol kinase (ATP)